MNYLQASLNTCILRISYKNNYHNNIHGNYIMENH